MKINRNDLEKIYNPVKHENNINANEHRAKGEAEPMKDRITLSNKAKEFSPVNNLTLKVVDEVTKQAPSQKLLSLKNDIASGRYHVSGEDIAAAIIGTNPKDQ